MRRYLIVAALCALCGPAGAQSTVIVPANGHSGGLNAVNWSARCPRGMVMKGITVVLGGTCHNQCDPDGRPVSTFSVICGPIEE